MGRKSRMLIECEKCGSVVPVTFQETGDVRFLGTGGDCEFGDHNFRLERGRESVHRGM